jgi:adenosylcobinamide kinase / adenosylcobinamide-phosphate guanylyltransferase
MGQLIFILGGVRSGKSSYAEKIAREQGGDDVLYVATAEVKDDEMQDRAEKHRTSRPSTWRTLEAPYKVGERIKENVADSKIILVDCITMLVANHLLGAAGPKDDPFGDPSADPFNPAIEAAIIEEAKALAACAHDGDADMLVVSNEVGMGVVPAYDLGRAYRDMLGRANQELARHADQVYLLVAGLPMKVK